MTLSSCAQTWERCVRRQKEVESGDALKSAPAGGAASGAKAAGGMMGGMLGAMEKMADQVQDAAAGAAGAAAAAGLNVAADALDAAVSKVEEPFQKVGCNVVTKKKADIINCFVEFINGYRFTEPIKMVRGEAPWSAEQYKKVPSDAISKWLAEKAKAELVKKLYPVTEAEVKADPVTNTWDSAVDKFNSFHDAVTKAGVDLEGQGVKKMSFDLPTYITTEIVNELMRLMAEAETATRADPAGKDTTKPISFAKIFSPVGLTEPDYTEWETVKQT